MCGDRRIVEGITAGTLFARDDDDSQTEAGRGKGKEVEQVPLCRRCVNEIQAGGKSLGEEYLIPLALDRVDRFDGGLSRRRWEAHQDRDSSPPSHPLPPLPQNIDAPEAACRTSSPIYVDIHDPLGSPAFERSPTKPIPKWMQYLPSARKASNETRPFSILDIHFSRPDSGTAMPTDDTIPPPVPPHRIPVGTHPPVPPHITDANTHVPDCMTFRMSRPFTLINEDPVQRPSGAKGPGVAGGKHVRFDGATACAIPSASAEFLERYSIGRPLDTSSRVSVEDPTSLENKPKTFGSQRHAHGCDSFVSGISKESGFSSMARTVENRVPGSFDGAYGTDQYSASLGSYKLPDEGWTGKSRGRPLGLTFQDQLKRVFGFT